MKFYTHIDQDNMSIYIDISILPLRGGGSIITAKKHLSPVTVEPEPAQISFNVSFGNFKVSEIGDVIQWIEAARDIAQALDEEIKTREDFKRKFCIKEARFTGLPVLAKTKDSDDEYE